MWVLGFYGFGLWFLSVSIGLRHGSVYFIDIKFLCLYCNVICRPGLLFRSDILLNKYCTNHYDMNLLVWELSQHSLDRI
jgi:hypothetical protein